MSHSLISLLEICSSMLDSSARIFFGRCSVMAKALGSSVDEEQKPGLHKIAQVRDRDQDHRTVD